MNAVDIVSAVSNHGYELTLADGNIRYRGNGGLPDDLMKQLRNRKQVVVIHLSAVERLTTIAEEIGWPADDLLDWYQHDMKDIARLPMPEVRFIVQDYIENHKVNRGEA